jgi:hypothetical protein
MDSSGRLHRKKADKIKVHSKLRLKFRVFVFLRMWLEEYYDKDFHPSKTMRFVLKSFISNLQCLDELDDADLIALYKIKHIAKLSEQKGWMDFEADNEQAGVDGNDRRHKSLSISSASSLLDKERIASAPKTLKRRSKEMKSNNICRSTTYNTQNEIVAAPVVTESEGVLSKIKKLSWPKRFGSKITKKFRKASSFTNNPFEDIEFENDSIRTTDQIIDMYLEIPEEKSADAFRASIFKETLDALKPKPDGSCIDNQFIINEKSTVIAQHFCVLDSEFLQGVQWDDLLNMTWANKSGADDDNKVRTLVSRFNRVGMIIICHLVMPMGELCSSWDIKYSRSSPYH